MSNCFVEWEIFVWSATKNCEWHQNKLQWKLIWNASKMLSHCRAQKRYENERTNETIHVHYIQRAKQINYHITHLIDVENTIFSGFFRAVEWQCCENQDIRSKMYPTNCDKKEHKKIIVQFTATAEAIFKQLSNRLSVCISLRPLSPL